MTPPTVQFIPAAGGPIGGAELWQVTGPGTSTNLSGQDPPDTNCSFSFSATPEGVIGFSFDTQDRLLIQFTSSTLLTAFFIAYPPGTGLAIISDGSFVDQVVTWSSATARANVCIRYNNPVSASLADLRSDLASSSGFTISFREPA